MIYPTITIKIQHVFDVSKLKYNTIIDIKNYLRTTSRKITGQTKTQSYEK